MDFEDDSCDSSSHGYGIDFHKSAVRPLEVKRSSPSPNPGGSRKKPKVDVEGKVDAGAASSAARIEPNLNSPDMVDDDDINTDNTSQEHHQHHNSPAACAAG
jgi:hypothetical protein